MKSGSQEIKRYGIIILIVVAVFLAPLLIWRFTRDQNTKYLPRVDKLGHLGLSNALTYNITTKHFESQSISLADISQLLWSMQGITSPYGFRVAPSAGGLYPLEIFVNANLVSGLEAGVYRYIPSDHSLKMVPHNQTLQLGECVSSEDSEVIQDASGVFIICAEYNRTTKKYGERGVQYVHLEVGHVLQNALLQLASLELNASTIIRFDEGMLQGYLNTTYVPLLMLPVGIAAESTRNQEHLPWNNQDEMTVEEAINNRRSKRDYLNRSLPSDSLLALLGNCTNLQLLTGNISNYDVRVVIRNVSGLDTGLYDFHLRNDSLRMLINEDVSYSLFEAGLGQPWILEAQANLVLSCDSRRTNKQHDSERQWRAMLYSVGMLGQIVYLKCTSLGLGTVSIGGLYENQVADVVDAPKGFTSIYIMPIGLL